jgi:hypothetical protein
VHNRRLKIGSTRHQTEHALWVCGCVTPYDAPTWLIYDGPGGVNWCRIPDGLVAADVVDARFIAGGHADPTHVLAWLSGVESDPWADGDGCGDEIAVRELGRMLFGA